MLGVSIVLRVINVFSCEGWAGLLFVSSLSLPECRIIIIEPRRKKMRTLLLITVCSHQKFVDIAKSRLWNWPRVLDYMKTWNTYNATSAVSISDRYRSVNTPDGLVFSGFHLQPTKLTMQGLSGMLGGKEKRRKGEGKDSIAIEPPWWGGLTPGCIL